MVLVNVAGVVSRKVLISANITMRQLLKKLVPEECNHSSLFIIIKHAEANKKMCAPDRKLREVHEKYSDGDGYLNMEIVK
jgi:chorismate synthase